MKIVNCLAKILQASLVILLIVLLTTDAAYARGGCFGSGTKILTPNGDRQIEQLHPGDRIVGFNLATHQTEEEEIGEIHVIHSPGYYLINGSIKVTGTHPFYVQSPKGLQLVEVRNLRIGDLLLEVNNTYLVSSINYIKEPITVYNLLSITPDHNFYADGVLVHNKGGSSGGGYAGGWHANGGHRDVQPINEKTVPSLMLSLMILLVVLLPFAFFHEIQSLARFWGKEFTNDAELIEFTKTVNPKFTNCYSVYYSEDNETWKMVPASDELQEQEYQNFISRAELVEQICYLFAQYQSNWTQKNFEKMTEYVAQPFYTNQYNRFGVNFGDNFDVVYQPELIEVVPLSYRQEDKIFHVQINARMVDFELSPDGFFLSGKAYPRSFTEYWDVGVDDTEKCYLVKISQGSAVLTTAT